MAAIQTPIGSPKNRARAMARNVLSRIRTVSPCRNAVAIPTQANPTPSAAMKDGVRSHTCAAPLIPPSTMPSTIAAGIAKNPNSRPVVLLATSTDTSTAQRARTPSTERSILPIRMMKVAPMVSTTGTEAEFSSRARFQGSRNLALKIETNRQRSTSTATGARARCRRSISTSLARIAPSCVKARSPVVLRTAKPPWNRGRGRISHGRGDLIQRYWIWPDALPQKSMKSSGAGAPKPSTVDAVTRMPVP